MMVLKTLKEAIGLGLLKFGDIVELDSTILPRTDSIVLGEETGMNSDQTITRENHFYYLGKERDDVVKFVATKSTEDKLYLQGERGFENGLNILNKVCSELFSNKILGLYAYPLGTKEFWLNFLEEPTSTVFTKITSRGEAILATPYIGKDDESNMIYGFKTILGHVELLRGNLPSSGSAGIIPAVKMYLPEKIYYLEKEGKKPRLICG